MYLQKLKLTNFRNYSDLELQLQPGCYFLVGENGQGKTNLLEAIFCAGTGRSALSSNSDDLILEKCQQAVIEAEFMNSHVEQVGIQLDRSGPKWIKLNHKNLARTSDLLGKISVVILLPKDLQIIVGGPQKRREFLDEVLCNQSPRYLQALLDYQRMLKQKNSYLRDCKIHKRTADIMLIESLNGALLEPAVQIFLKRQEFIQKLQTEMQRMYHEVFPVLHQIDIQHVCDVGAACDEGQYRTGLLSLLQRSMNFEIKKGHALVGPAHDDVKIMLDGRNSRHFASNGQKRLLSLALRMVQGELLQNGEATIYLVDDVLLELDAAHRGSVLQCLRRAQQVFFTTTSTHWLGEDVVLRGTVLRVESGHVVATGIGGGFNTESGDL